MASPLTLRRPSPATASPEAIAAFVDAADSTTDPAPALNAAAVPVPSAAKLSTVLRAVANDEPSTSAPSFRRASRAVVHRRTKPSRRRTTVYLDVEVATELAAVLTLRDQELSDAVNAAVRAWLNVNR